MKKNMAIKKLMYEDVPAYCLKKIAEWVRSYPKTPDGYVIPSADIDKLERQ